MTKICICGGGNLGQTIAGFISSKSLATVNVLTRNPLSWLHNINVITPNGEELIGNINIINDNPKIAIEDSNIVLLCVPGTANKTLLQQIKPFITNNMYVGCVFASSGFFFEAAEILGNNVPLWGFQRVPFISRIEDYGKMVTIKGYKKKHYIAIENSDKKFDFKNEIERLFQTQTELLSNFYEATFTNSNSLLHTSLLYSMFKSWNLDVYYDSYIPFYESWNDETSSLYIDMDKELYSILNKIPHATDHYCSVLNYYESYDNTSLTNKIKSIFANKGFSSPVVLTDKGWIPNTNSRYFQEDFGKGLYYIYKKAKELNLNTPSIDKVFMWGYNLINS